MENAEPSQAYTLPSRSKSPPLSLNLSISMSAQPHGKKTPSCQQKIYVMWGKVANSTFVYQMKFRTCLKVNCFKIPHYAYSNRYG